MSLFRDRHHRDPRGDAPARIEQSQGKSECDQLCRQPQTVCRSLHPVFAGLSGMDDERRRQGPVQCIRHEIHMDSPFL